MPVCHNMPQPHWASLGKQLEAPREMPLPLTQLPYRTTIPLPHHPSGSVVPAAQSMHTHVRLTSGYSQRWTCFLLVNKWDALGILHVSAVLVAAGKEFSPGVQCNLCLEPALHLPTGQTPLNTSDWHANRLSKNRTGVQKWDQKTNHQKVILFTNPHQEMSLAFLFKVHFISMCTGGLQEEPEVPSSLCLWLQPGLRGPFHQCLNTSMEIEHTRHRGSFSVSDHSDKES